MATLAELRADFREASGRADMLDVEVDKWISYGLKYLDKTSDFTHAPRKLVLTATIGNPSVRFTARCRLVYKVWVADDESRTELDKLLSTELRVKYPGPIADIDSARPIYYVFDTMASQNAMGLFQFNSGATLATSYTYNSVLVFPPPDKAYQVEVDGRFYSEELTLTTSNWWAEQEPDLVIMAAMRMMETRYRNRAGILDQEANMAPLVKGLDDDLADEEAAGIWRMEG